MSNRSLVLAVGLAISAGVVATGRSQAPQANQVISPEAQWTRALEEWNLGKYPDALADLKTLTKSPAAAEFHDRIALLTGELYSTTELTTDGRNPKISGNGQYASYETGPNTDPITRIVKLGTTPLQTTEIHATGIVFDPGGTRVAWVRVPAGADPASSELVVRDLASGREEVWLGAGAPKSGLLWSGNGQRLIFVGVDPVDPAHSDVYEVGQGANASIVSLTNSPGLKAGVMLAEGPGVRALVYSEGRAGGPGGGRAGGGAPGAAGGRAGGGGAGGGGGGRGAGGAPPAGTTYTVVDLATKATRTITGTALTASADGSTLAWVSRTADAGYVLSVSPTLKDAPVTIRSGREAVTAPSLSPDGKLVAYQYLGGPGSSTDQEIYISDLSGVHRRLTRDIQDDLLPRFLSSTTVLGLKGEPRHRRSYLYDVNTGVQTRLFSNNSIRTISPEYIWLPSTDGKHLVIQSERDGDTISPERGVYVVDLTRKITAAELGARLDTQLAVENDLRDRMTKAFQPIADSVRRVVSRVSATRAYEYQKAQFDFDSKHVSQPGNQKAIAYLEKTYASFGYTPEVQWFSPAQAQGNRTGNIVSMLKGTVNPELIYVVSSHFDSVAGGPGADDDTSGTCALLETARALADTPMPATIVFASFTGEEAGLLGSREFVRLAGERKWQIVGALNNDMIGWAGESARMDNTIRYSNAGIRDIQHGAAFLFTNLVTYDAKYYKGTDANAFYDGWGDIVGGIGSYPVLANPNYHKATDLLETINMQQVAETAKTTAATLMYLASSPSRLKDLKATKSGSGVDVTWTASPESGIKSYIVAYGPAGQMAKMTRMTVTTPKATLPALPAGTEVAVKAVNSRGLEAWDWARVIVP